MDFNPNSPDAMFSKVLQRLDTQDEILGRIERGVAKTNGRVTVLERWRDVTTAKTAVIASVISLMVGIASWLFSH